MNDELRGLKALIQDAVHHGSLAVERIQKETAKRPFTILEAIPIIDVPARGIHAIHDTVVSAVHGIIRGVNQVAGAAFDQLFEAPSSAKDARTDRPPLERGATSIGQE